MEQYNHLGPWIPVAMVALYCSLSWASQKFWRWSTARSHAAYLRELTNERR